MRSLVVFATLIGSVRADAQDEFRSLPLKDGDRIVLLGGTFFEADVATGFLETSITLAHPKKKLTFRNLGWSGDTVWAESRGIFDSPAKGYARMVKQVKALKPTLVVFAYGRNESFAGPEGLAKFLAQYDRLLKDVLEAKTRAVVLFQPEPLSALEPPKHWESYAKAIGKKFASRASVVDWRKLRCRPASPSDNRNALQRAIAHKNQLYLKRYRPPNITYLYLFRKHEQGNNAKEIEKLDGIIAAEEKKIAELKAKVAAEK